MVYRSETHLTDKSLVLQKYNVKLSSSPSFLAYCVRRLKRSLSSRSELLIGFKPATPEIYHLLVSLFVSNFRIINYITVSVVNYPLDNKRCTLTFMHFYNIQKIRNYIFLRIKSEEGYELYYTTVDELKSFVDELEKANEEGIELDSEEKLKYNTYATLH